MAEKEGIPYYQWWNENAILGCKLETLEDCRKFVKMALQGKDVYF